MVDVSCPHCGVKLKAPEDRIGKKAKCKKCQQLFRVPGPMPMADSVSEPPMLSTSGMPIPQLPVPDGDDRTEIMEQDPLPLPKAKPAPAPVPLAQDLAALPSADPFDFSQPTAPVAKPAPTPTAKPAASAPKVIPPVAKPALTPAPAAKPPSGAVKARPVAKAAEPAPGPIPPASAAEPLEDIPFDEPEPPKTAKPKAKTKGAPEPEPEPVPVENAFAFAFGFTNEPAPEAKKPLKSKRRDEDDEELEEKPRKKKRDEDESEGDDSEDKPRYRRPAKKGGTGKMLLITGAVGFLALGLAAVAVVVYAKNNKPEVAKEEKKKEEPIPESLAPPAIPPVAPKDKVDPKKPKDADSKAKEKEPDAKPKSPDPQPKDPEPAFTRPALELAGKFKPFEIGKEPAKFERADKPGEPRYVLDTEFGSVLRVFPPFDPKSADTYVVVRTGAKLSLDAYSPSSEKRVSRLEFAADPAGPLCDLYSSATDTRFLAVSDGRLTVWDLTNQKALFEGVDPYSDKPEHKTNGLAAAFFSTQPDQVVTVSTAGAVHLYSLPAKVSVASFVPPSGAKGKVALGASVARTEDGGSIVLAVGGVLYQIRADNDLGRLRTHDLGGDVKPLAVAGSGTPGRLLFAFETDTKMKKDRALLYLPAGAEAKPVISLWSADAKPPKSAFWVNDSSVGVVTESGVVWFDEELNKFGPVVVTRPTGGGLYLGDRALFWYVVPHPSKPAQSVLVPLAVPFGDVFEFRRAAATKLRVVRIDSNGLAK